MESERQQLTTDDLAGRGDVESPSREQRDGEPTPHADREELPRADGEELPRADGEELPRADGEGLPHADGEGLPHADGEGLPHADGEELPHADGKGLPRADGERSEHLDEDLQPPESRAAARGEMHDQSDGDPTQPLLDEQEAGAFRQRWESVQTGFVDEPRRSVEDADQLVAELMQNLAETFSRERKGLEHNWDRGDDVSTEDLRVALRRYRTFFDRLLAT